MQRFLKRLKTIKVEFLLLKLKIHQFSNQTSMALQFKITTYVLNGLQTNITKSVEWLMTNLRNRKVIVRFCSDAIFCQKIGTFNSSYAINIRYVNLKFLTKIINNGPSP